MRSRTTFQSSHGKEMGTRGKEGNKCILKVLSLWNREEWEDLGVGSNVVRME